MTLTTLGVSPTGNYSPGLIQHSECSHHLINAAMLTTGLADSLKMTKKIGTAEAEFFYR